MFTAILISPTYTSELYEWTIRDLVDLQQTKLFRTSEAALQWAQKVLATANEERAEYSDDEYAHTKTVDEGNGVWAAYWSTNEDYTTDETFCLVVRPVDFAD